MPLVCCGWLAAVGVVVGDSGLGGGRGGGSAVFWVGFGGGRGGDLSAGLIGGISAILGAEADGEMGADLVTGGSAGLSTALEIF